MCLVNTYSIGKFAALLGASVKTLQRWDREGSFKAKRTPTGRRFYTEDQLAGFVGHRSRQAERRSVVYCRVSSQAQKPDLKNQKAKLEEFCLAKGIAQGIGN